MGSLKKNIGYQTIWQILATCIPLFTSPYISRVLGADQLGVFSFTSSIVSYFSLFASLGTIQYGTRSIAVCRTEKRKVSKCFFGIYLFQAFVAVVLTVVYILVCAFFFRSEYFLVALIQGFQVFAYCFDVSWLFFGLEKFKNTVVRNIVVKVISVLSIFAFVRDSSDLWVYTFVIAFGMVGSNFVLWVQVPSVVDLSEIKRISANEVLRKVKPNISLFFPRVGESVYHSMDKTLLGVMSSELQSGYYYNSDKMISIPMGIFDGFGNVLFPRMSSLFASNQKNRAKDLFDLSCEFFILFSVAISIGIAAVSEEFVPLFFGPGFDECIILVHLFAPILVIKSLTVVSRMLYLIPTHREKLINVSVFGAAFINLIANIVLIPRFGAFGAVIGTFLAELSCCVVQHYFVLRELRNFRELLYLLEYSVSGLLMYLCVRLFANSCDTNILLKLIGEIIIGCLSYVFLCCCVWKIQGRNVKGTLLKLVRLKDE